MLRPGLLSVVHASSALLLSLRSHSSAESIGIGLLPHGPCNLCCRISLPNSQGDPPQSQEGTQMEARTGRLFLQVEHGMGKRHQLCLGGS